MRTGCTGTGTGGGVFVVMREIVHGGRGRDGLSDLP